MRATRRIAPWSRIGVLGLLGLAGCVFGGGTDPRVESASEGMRLGRAAFEAGRYEEADELFDAMQSRHPEVFPDEVLFKRARANFQIGEYAEAFALYDRLVDEYFSTPYASQIIEDELVIGRKYLDGEIRWLGIFPRRGQGVRVLEHLITSFPRSPEAEEAHRLIAEYYFEDEAFADAALEYQELRKKHPTSRWKPVYDFRRAVALRRECKGVAYDRDRLQDALLAFEEYLTEWRPKNHAYVERAEAAAQELRAMLGLKEYQIGDYYESEGSDFGARYHYEKAIRDYPSTRGAEAAAEALPGVTPAEDQR